MLYKFILPVCLLFIFLTCRNDDAKNPSDSNNNNDTTIYEVTFYFKWNSTDFPTAYPSNPHFSRLIGWSHKTSTTFFKVGTTASDGIEGMAEVGSTSTLLNELNLKIKKNEGLKAVVGNGLGSGVGSVKVSLEVNKEYPAITIATMIAPSPDWYIAVVNTNLFENNKFADCKIVDALAYDAGTDDGTTFTSANKDSNPQKNITLITNPPLGNGTTVMPRMATVTFCKKIGTTV